MPSNKDDKAFNGKQCGQHLTTCKAVFQGQADTCKAEKEPADNAHWMDIPSARSTAQITCNQAKKIGEQDAEDKCGGR